MMNPEETMPVEAPVEGAPAPVEDESKFDMETMVGNMLDLPDNERKIASRMILSPMASILDKIVGEPVFTRMNQALGEANKTEGAFSGEATPEGMMAPAETPVEAPVEAPAEEEEIK